MRKDISAKKRKRRYIIIFTVLFLSAIALYFALHPPRFADNKDDENTMQVKTFLETGILHAQDIGKSAGAGEFIKDGKPQYSALFGKSVVIGDSITEGLLVYGFLTEEQSVCEIGGSVMKSDEAIASAAGLSPEKAFFSYGTNDMGMYSGNSQGFIKQYSAVIEKFMEMSPDTKVYVNSIPKPSDGKISSGGYFYKWEDFNSEIKAMCERMDIEYIDNTYILIEHPELYGGDGIHVSPSYYPYWIGNMIKGSV